MVRDAKELTASISAIVGQDDESLALLEDLTDTFDDLASRGVDPETIRQAVTAELSESFNETILNLRAENDSLRERYKKRFNGEVSEEPPAAAAKPITPDDLFK